MSNGAYINLEVNPLGQLEASVVYKEGYDLENGAHQVARLLMEHLGTIADPIGEPKTVLMPDDPELWHAE